MPSEQGSASAGDDRAPARREAVLAAALATFSRSGYRKTSMEEVAEAARISRPGLYFLFRSKGELFAEAVASGLERDLAAAVRALQEDGRPLADRLVDAFDAWSGRYVGAAGAEISAVVDAHPDLLGDVPRLAAERFRDAVASAVREAGAGTDPETAAAVARTLVSTAIGVKQQVGSPQAFHEEVRTAVDLLLR